MPCNCGCGGSVLCLAEKLRYWRENGGLQIDPRATPTRRNTIAPARTERGAWEAGRAGEHRPDGSFMPFLDDRGNTIGLKRFAEERHSLTQARQRRLAGAAPKEG